MSFIARPNLLQTYHSLRCISPFVSLRYSDLTIAFSYNSKQIDMVRNQTYNFIDIFERKSKTYHCLPHIEAKRTHRLFIHYIMNSIRLETSLHLQFHFLHYTTYPSVCIIISRTINLRFSRSSRIFFFIPFTRIKSYRAIGVRQRKIGGNFERKLGTAVTVTRTDTTPRPFVSIECVNLRADETTELRKKRVGH